MKKNMLPTPENLTLSEVMERFATEDKAREYLEAIQWLNGPVCPHCQNADSASIYKIKENKAKKIRAGLYRCAKCNKEFTVTVNTIFEDSHIPLNKWLIAWYMISSSKKGISALQMQRMLGFGSYRTAWMMMHKIRHAMKDPVVTGKLDGEVEVDETYVGGKPRPAANGSKYEREPGKGFRKNSNKIPVVALVQRDGNVRTKVVASVTHKNLRAFVHDNIAKTATVNTDQFNMYRALFAPWARHDKVNHSIKQYARHNADGTVSHINKAPVILRNRQRSLHGGNFFRFSF